MGKLNKRNILFLGANYDGLLETRLTSEYTCIQESIEKSEKKSIFTLLPPRFKVNEKNIVEYIDTNSPWLLHFAGHGVRAGGVKLESTRQNLQGVTISKNRIIEFIEGCPSIMGVFFNSCYSGALKRELFSRVHFFIGIEGIIPDKDAIELAREVYTSIMRYRSISYALEKIERNLALQDVGNFKLVTYSKFNLKMEIANLEIEISEKREKLGSTSRKSKKLESEIVELEADLLELTQVSALHFNELMSDSKNKTIIGWFNEEKHRLAIEIANDSLSKAEYSNDDRDRLSSELILLLNLLDVALLGCDLSTIPEEETKGLIDWRFSPETYKSALLLLPKKAKKHHFEEKDLEFLKETVHYLCDII